MFTGLVAGLVPLGTQLPPRKVTEACLEAGTGGPRPRSYG
jgi:hypothetical protein